MPWQSERHYQAPSQQEQGDISSWGLLSCLLSIAWNLGLDGNVRVLEKGVQLQFWYELSMEKVKWTKKIYWWSISSKISCPFTSPCSSTKYSPIQVTRWSLNVPLITWWRISPQTPLWISAQGKSFVNSWEWVQISIVRVVKWSLATYDKISYYTIILPQTCEIEKL